MPEALEEILDRTLTLSKDPEVDKSTSPATESSHGEEESDTMFPAANDTAATSDTQAKVAGEGATAGELSPPYSQDPPDVNDDEAMDLSGAEAAWETLNNVLAHKVDGNGEGAVQGVTTRPGDMYRPGAWDTPKAMEEYHRQWNGLLDKNFSLKQFGEPFDDDSPPKGTKGTKG